VSDVAAMKAKRRKGFDNKMALSHAEKRKKYKKQRVF
jgi:hypothetical protein